jgi:hypothetical protein
MLMKPRRQTAPGAELAAVSPTTHRLISRWARPSWRAHQRDVPGLRHLPKRLRFGRAQQRRAQQQADEAIRRAQRKARRDGNVIRPEAFKGPRNAH